MVAPLPSMAAALRLDDVGEHHFRAPSPTDARQHRIFGGQALGQAVMAAARTVAPGFDLHQLHGRFFAAGDPGRELDHRVDAFLDRGSFAHRRVTVTQGERSVLELSASFHRREDGPEHQFPTQSGGEPEMLPTVDDLAGTDDDEDTRHWWGRLSQWLPVDVRAAAVPGRWNRYAADDVVPQQQVWLRGRDDLGDDPHSHAAALAYCSDLFLLTAAMVRHGLRHGDDGVLAVTLNHTMWFHRPVRTDDWWRYDQEGSWSGAGRQLCRGQMFDRDGRLVATAMQEGLLRVATDQHQAAG